LPVSSIFSHGHYRPIIGSFATPQSINALEIKIGTSPGFVNEKDQ
jgi:hypothetical protein